MKGYIYQIINKENQKRYVGQTMNFEKRHEQHLDMLNKKRHHSQKLQRAWDKYGEQNFYFVVEEFDFPSRKELLQKEKDTIKFYDSYFNGYNMTIGGEGSIRKHFTFNQYCFIKIGNASFEAMCNKTAKLFNVDCTVITDIVHNKTYLDYYYDYINLPEEKFNVFKEEFIQTFNIDVNNPPKLLNKKKVDNNVLCNCLCIITYYENVGKTLEEIFGYAKGTMSHLKTGRYKTVWNMFNQLTDFEKEKRADFFYLEYNVENRKLARLMKQGGSARAYQLEKEDYYYAFLQQTLGKTYTEVANILGVKPATVKDWFNGRARSKEREQFNILSTEQLEVLKSRY